MKLTQLLFTLLLLSCGNEPQKSTLPEVPPTKIQFFETYSYAEILPSWEKAVTEYEKYLADSLQASNNLASFDYVKLSTLLKLDGNSVFGYTKKMDISLINEVLNNLVFKQHFPEDLRFMWSYKAEKREYDQEIFALHLVKMTPEGLIAPKQLESVTSKFSENNLQYVITITMTEEGSKKWEAVTKKNVGRAIAITVDERVLTCPTVYQAILGKETEISGSFTKKEAEILAKSISLAIP